MCFFRECFAREPRTQARDRFDRAGLSKRARINFVGQHAKESSSSQREYKYTTVVLYSIYEFSCSSHTDAFFLHWYCLNIEHFFSPRFFTGLAPTEWPCAYTYTCRELWRFVKRWIRSSPESRKKKTRLTTAAVLRQTKCRDTFKIASMNSLLRPKANFLTLLDYLVRWNIRKNLNVLYFHRINTRLNVPVDDILRSIVLNHKSFCRLFQEWIPQVFARLRNIFCH